jgi:hypothetical protein
LETGDKDRIDRKTRITKMEKSGKGERKKMKGEYKG